MAEAPRDGNHITGALFESSATPGLTLPGKIDPVTGRILVDSAGGGGTGTVTSVSVVSANGFAGTVATATTTPAITLTTTINSPVLAGNGTAIAAATTTGSGSTVVLATSPVLITPNLGTPSAVVLTNATGLPIAGITGLGAGIGTWLATPSSANLAAAVTDETGSGALVFATSPTLVTPTIGAATGTSLTLVASGNPASFSNISDTTPVQVLSLSGNRATPTAGDEIYQSFNLNSSTGTSREFARIRAVGTTVTNTAEVGALKFSVMVAGTLTGQLQIIPGVFTPLINDGVALGSATLTFSDLFLASGAVINFANGNAAITHSTGVIKVTTGDLQVTSANVGTASDSVATLSSTNTYTNKRITPRVGTTTSSATPTINTDQVDCYSITALAAAITSFTTNLSGTPTDFQKLIIRIKDNGTARAISWGASFVAEGVALPTTTVISKVLTVGFLYDSVKAAWGCVASAQET